MGLKGFTGDNTFNNSKVASRKVASDSARGGRPEIPWGKNSSKVNIGLASKTKAAVNPTSDEDDNMRASGMGAPQANGDEPMVPSSKGGASGDGATPGFTGSGSGIAQLNGAQGRI